ncbi:MAG TPA: cytochrome P450 [Candidatus Atopostipes pullistercoris]|uniref:Cytochrome P450 n=1 Tax=Candidatus Atopostipes pullistercoris TaxID=2838467 RepID=A0A9D2G3C9_9LACT|nr:cytochrome P450 [Candidatus Atopostipes pullistercoris]
MEVPEVRVKLHELEPSYTLLTDIREKAGAPVAKAEAFTKKLYVIYGSDAAQKFYDPKNFKREGAMPDLVIKTLFGEDGVQTLDGEEHHHRKNIFMDLMAPDRMDDYHKILDEKMTAALEAEQGTFELFSLTRRVLFETVTEWSGINLDHLSDEEIDDLSKYQISMISGTFTSTVDHLKGVEDRKRSERWARKLIQSAREHPVPGKENVALYAFAQATDLDGELLPLDVAAVELLNIIRPTLALTVWAALMGHALFSRSDIYDQLKDNFDELQDSFIHEMRRYYPFFPAVPGISLQDVEIDGYLIPEGSWVALDLYGTNHDARTIDQPEEFKVDRYKGDTERISYEEEYEMIAQGGGEFRSMHRCAGEWITLHTLRVLSDHLVNKYEFSVPEQDFEIPMNQFPTYPNSKVLLYKEEK